MPKYYIINRNNSNNINNKPTPEIASSDLLSIINKYIIKVIVGHEEVEYNVYKEHEVDEAINDLPAQVIVFDKCYSVRGGCECEHEDEGDKHFPPNLGAGG
jgi:hypothetical protein